MACGVIRTWTLSKLVGAFLDLWIAYMMLCGSTFAYFASKFLGFFGLNLPCPCNGLFGNPNEAYCAQRLLLEYPVERISSVHSSVKSKFPFDLICGEEGNCQVKMNRCISFDDRPLELEGEGSCSSVSDARKVHDSTGWELVSKNVASPKAGRLDLKRKGIAYQRPKSGIRRRRKFASDNDRKSLAASYEPCGYDQRETPNSSFTFNKEVNGENVAHDGSNFQSFLRNDEKSVENDWENDVPENVGLDLSVGKYSNGIEDALIIDEFRDMDEEERKFTGEAENDVKALEQALKEEKAARAALYLELEKERNAAATAADEAMGMILRLQEEKATIEMQARQYQRMIEEKSAYDAEEMNLLKEILLRRERETFVLEKEVESYKEIILEGETSGEGVPEMQEEYGMKESSSLDCDDDPLSMLHEISESIRKKENDKRIRTKSEDTPVAFQNDTLSYEGLKTPHDSETIEDKLVSVNIESPNELLETQRSEQQVNKQESNDDGSDENADSSQHDRDTPVVDVHVVGHELASAERISGKSSSNNDVSGEDFAFKEKDNSNDRSSTSRLDSQFESMRRHSDIPSRSPPFIASKIKVFREEGSSLSAVDFERLKIENEVELLREKLRIVQEGRETLNLSLEHSEGEKVQLQLLEDIANQLRQIRLIRAPERSARQASVPVPSSKVEMKKRRSRSVSSSLNNSS